MPLIRALDVSGIFHPIWRVKEAKGEPIGSATAETIQTLRERAEARGADYVVACCDSGRSFRHAIGLEWQATHPDYKGYKGHRPAKDPAMMAALDRVIDELVADGVPVLRAAGFEADDVIATVTEWAIREGHDVEIATEDKDLMQLVRDGARRVTVVRRGGEVFGPAEVTAKFGVPPEKLGEYLAIVGDSSDHVPGVRGFGDKAARAIITEYGGFAAAVKAAREEAELVARGAIGDAYEPRFTPAQRAKLIDGEAAFLLSLRLTTLRADVPIDCSRVVGDRAPPRDETQDAEMAALLAEGDAEAEEEARLTAIVAAAQQQQRIEETMSTTTIADAEFTETQKAPSDRPSEPVARPETTRAPEPTTAPAQPVEGPRAPAAMAPQQSSPAKPAEVKRDALAVAAPAMSDRPFQLQLEPRNPKEADWLARCLYQSKQFKDLVSPEAAYVKIAVGRSMGLTLYQSLSLHMFQGRVVKPAMMIVAQIRQHPQCEFFRKRIGNGEHAVWESKRKGDPRIAEWEFTIQEARDAQLVKADSGWAKYPKNMLSWRAATFLAREEWAEVVGDFLTPEEVADIRGNGDAIDTVGEAA